MHGRGHRKRLNLLDIEAVAPGARRAPDDRAGEHIERALRADPEDRLQGGKSRLFSRWGADHRSAVAPVAAEEPPASGLGLDLRNARIQAGYEVAQVAQTLRIRRPYLEALESGRYDELPGAPYAIGFVRTYAQFLGIDGEAAVHRFKAEASGLTARTALAFPSPAPEGRVPGGAIMFVSLVLALVVYGGWYYLSSADRQLADLVPQVPERLVKLIDGGRTAVREAQRGEAVAAIGRSEEPVLPAPSNELAGTDRDPSPGAAASPDSVSPTSSGGNHMSAAVVAPPGASAPVRPAAAPATREVAVVPAPASAEPRDVAPSTTASPTVTTDTGASTSAASSTAVVSPTTVPSIATSVPVAPPAVAAAGPQAAAREPAPARSEPTETALPPAAGPPAGPEPAAVRPAAPARPPSAEAATPPVASQQTSTPRPVEIAPPVAAAPATPVPSGSAPAAAAARAPAAPAIPAAPQLAALSPDGAVAAPRAAGRIVIQATGESWVQVRDGDAVPVITRVMKAGDQYVVPDRPGMTLYTGNAGALRILVDGTAVPQVGPFGKVMRDVALDAERLRSGTATTR